MPLWATARGTKLKTVAPTNDWSKAEVDLSAYAGQAAVKVRVAYENSASSADDMKAMGLKLDTFEIFEDGVRTFSDLCSSKVFLLVEGVLRR